MDAYTERRLALELEHLLKWAADQTGFQEYAEWKARVLAQKYPQEMGDLPMLLSNAVNLKKHGPERPSTNQPRRSE